MLAVVEFRPRIGTWIDFKAFFHDFNELRERLAQDNPLIIWDIYLAQGFRDQVLAFSAASRAAV